LRRSVKAGEVPPPGELRPGELAANAADPALFVGKVDGTAGRLPIAEGVRRVEVVTQAAYDALVAAGTVESSTLYVVTG
jgi:hypothetical protein